jgi:hypothetical protein
MTRWNPNYAGRTADENILDLAQDIREHTPTVRPAFIHVMALSWVFGPTEIEKVCELLGSEYKPLLMPAFQRLYKAVVKP